MFVAIMAGGSGTRFWPASRKSKPKQFLNITGRGPMVKETMERLKPISREDQMILILGKKHLDLAQGLFRANRFHILAEPVGRNTAPAIGLGALYARHLGCTQSMAFLPADHFIGDPETFIRTLRAAGDLADKGGIVTMGIVPVRPETGYGYIRRGARKTDTLGQAAYEVSEFIEKPDLEKARAYLATGDYYWNGGIFIATPETILREIKTQLPGLHEGLSEIEQTLGTAAFEDTLAGVYADIPTISFDYGIMEHTREQIHVVPCECGWSDVGSWSSLYALYEDDLDDEGNLAEGNTLLVDCRKCFVSGKKGRLVACLGLDNCLVIDTQDTLLVADLDRSQDIRKIVDRLKDAGKKGLL